MGWAKILRAVRINDQDGLEFHVNGFKYFGIVRILYNMGTDLFSTEECQ